MACGSRGRSRPHAIRASSRSTRQVPLRTQGVVIAGTVIMALMIVAGCSPASSAAHADPTTTDSSAASSRSPATAVAGPTAAAGPASAARRSGTSSAAGGPFLTSVSPNGRYFLDQDRRPYLVFGDSPWSMAIDLSNSDTQWYFQQRRQQGFNSVLFSAFGGEGSGGSDSEYFTTFDGIAPFIDGDLTQYNEPYWRRLDGKIAIAQREGFTVFLYVMDTFGENGTFAQWDVDHTPEHDYRVARDYCSFVANRYRGASNVVYMLGGDYDNHLPLLYAGGMDRMMKGCADSIKMAAPDKLLSIQLTGYPQSNSFDYFGWITRPDFSFVYNIIPAMTRRYRATTTRGPHRQRHVRRCTWKGRTRARTTKNGRTARRR